MLEPETPAAGITAKLFPENADYTDIEFSCVLPNGTPTGLSEIELTEYGAKITGKGDGAYVIRASCRNGTDIPQVYSEIHMMNSGFGSLLLDPYTFISGANASFSNIPYNIIEKHAIFIGNERTVIGFDNLGFGDSGTDTIKLSCGFNDADIAYIELWLGDPARGGELFTTLEFKNNGRWEGFEEQEIKLPRRLKGNESIAFVFNKHIIFGGFEFKRIDRGFDRLYPADNDEIYGDDYNISGHRVTDIGNNVLITFKGLDLGEGANRITICGRTTNALNSIQLRYTGEDGVQHTQLLDFSQSFDLAEQAFPLETIKGVNDVCFVFMPGSKFDFDWFRFGK